MKTIRIECDNSTSSKVTGADNKPEITVRKCGKLLFKLIGHNLEIKCRNSKCKAISTIDILKLLNLTNGHLEPPATLATKGEKDASS